ncbi:MAG: hypothetical protein ACI4RR_02870 [Eubacterium sp.]
MESKIKTALKFIISKDGGKIKILVAVGLIGILLISMSEIFDTGKKTTEATGEETDYSQYCAELEDKLTDIISSIDGVGECKVMITLENSKENIYATDNENKSDNDSLSTKDEYVIYDSESGEKPVLIKENFPTVLGVTVVCSGGDNVKVRETIINTVTSVFNISTNRVSVSKIKTKR